MSNIFFNIQFNFLILLSNKYLENIVIISSYYFLKIFGISIPLYSFLFLFLLLVSPNATIKITIRKFPNG